MAVEARSDLTIINKIINLRELAIKEFSDGAVNSLKGRSKLVAMLSAATSCTNILIQFVKSIFNPVGNALFFFHSLFETIWFKSLPVISKIMIIFLF